ncbi:potassium channel SKOR-like [Vitis riparia]|uniref:potassium channel SKOR-like n=1 Tax=Vitis riparia TaxID=96939 RepID=UPI00155A8D1E|nr:potassium channel SKOR-like [Vitis riparia]
MDSNIDLLKCLLENGVNPNSRNYDLQTPLHFAAAEGLHLVANILIKFGADVLSKDRWEGFAHVALHCWNQNLTPIPYSYVDLLSEILSVMSGLVAARPQLPSHQIPNAGLI